MAYDIFISYSHKDKTIADAICSHLEGRGMRCWYAPRDITPGTEWGLAILNGIEQSKIMVLVFTKDANLSQQVLREVNNAVNAGLSIIPFRLTEEEPAAGMKYYLSTVHWMNAMNEELATSIRSLGELCRAILDREPVPETRVNLAGADSKKDEAEQKSFAAEKKRRAGLIAGVCAAAAIIVIVCIALFTRNSGESASSAPGSGPAVSSETAGTDSIGTAGTTDASSDASGDEPLSSGIISENVTADLSETYTRGNNQNNILNGGYLAYDGEWYYYRSNDGGKMYRMKEDGSEVTKLNDLPVSAISVADGWIYFVAEGGGLQKMKTDGSDLMTLPAANFNNSARIIGDRIYFTDQDLFSVNLDGEDYHHDSSLMGYNKVLDGTYQYYIDTETYRLYRAPMNGIAKEAECVYAHKTASLCISGNYLFFYDMEDNCELSCDLLTGEITHLFSNSANRPVATEEGLYYQSGSLKLAFYSFENREEEIISEDWVDIVHAAGNKIFYESNGVYYLIDKDGTGKVEL